MDVGATLRDAREQRGLSVHQLSHATKISVTILRAIETNRMDKVPDGIFLRGFLRAYAREVGLNPEDTVRRYLAQFEPVTYIVERAKPGTGEVRAEHTPAVGDERGLAEAERRVTRVPWLSVLMLVISVAAYYAVTWWRALAPVPPPLAGAIQVARSPSPAASSTAAATHLEAATAGSREPTAAAVATEGDRLHLHIQLHGLCWLAATIDGTRVVYRLVQPGEEQTLDVQGEAILRVGDPGAVVFSINGRAGQSLGRAGEAATVYITRENYREFLQR